MKKRILFSACVLAACVTACTNDDFMAEKNNNSVINEAGEVVGADLVSSGMSMTLSDGSASTRVTDNGWQVNDKSGLAWFQYDKNTAITATQNRTTWYKGTGTTPDDYNLYANHLFTMRDNGMWTTEGDIYQGAYFAYFPFDRLEASSKIKKIAPNALPQTEDFETEWQNKALMISSQDFIAQDDVTADLVLNDKPFILNPMVNILGVTLTPTSDISNDYLKGMVIKQMTISNGTSDKIFTTEAKLKPAGLPKAVNSTNGQRKTDKQIIEDLDEVLAASTAESSAILAEGVGSASLTTVVENADFNLSKDNKIRVFALPLQTGAKYTSETTMPSITVTMKNPKYDWNLGTFTISRNNALTEGETNLDALQGLRNIFNSDKSAGDNTWVANIVGTPGDVKRLSKTVELYVKDFNPTTNGIKSQDQWNDLVDLIDALHDAGKTFTTTPVFALSGEVKFKDAIKTPKDVQIALNTPSTSKMVIVKGDEEVEWPANLITTNNTTNIVVDEGATLKVGSDGTEVNLLASSIENNGTIMAGKNASISTSTTDTKYGANYGAKLDNKGRVIVEYGAYVYPSSGKEGVIAYVVTNTEGSTIGNINTLINKTDGAVQKGYAQVNTLVIDGVTLDLNAQATPAGGDRYETIDATQLSSLASINIELENGSIVYTTGTNKKVNDVTAVSGDNNNTTDVDVDGDIIVNDATLNVNSDKDPKWALTLQDVKNNGQLNVNTNMNVANLYNNNKIDVYSSLIVYTYTYDQKGDAYYHGAADIIKASETTEAVAVATAWNSVLASDGWDLATLSTYSNFISKVPNTLEEGWPLTDFFNAINAWRVANGRDAVSALTVEVLKDYEAGTNTNFGLKDA